MPSAVPVTWRAPTGHTNNYYFCMVPRVPYGEGLPVPDPPTSASFESDEESGEKEAQKNGSAGFQSDPNFDESCSSIRYIS